ncbi:metallothionein-like protein type 3 [Durio zibethinus]|uniref:Metallothionein-like protein type 3 n=1 Tax=Durio zibethinus TaxID=66656 RepID=A0A6P5WML5_DURZI|nr:metallothionein-like protein type 3 [Durio zibethinus]
MFRNSKKPSALSSHVQKLSKFTISDKCGNCDCADKSQWVKKGNTLVNETEKSHISTVVVETPAENDGKCKCGGCSRTNCTCGAH